MSASVDVVVVGAGHNGLTAACYLAKAGLDVVVVEAAASVGGLSATAALIPEAPDHRINWGALDVTFLRATNIVSELELERYGYRELDLDPPWVHLNPDDISIAFWRDPRRTAEELRAFSTHDADAYLRLARTLDALVAIALPMMMTNPTRPGARAVTRSVMAAARRRGELGNLVSLLTSPCLQVLEERFRHPVVRDAMASVCAAFGPVVGEGTAVVLLALGWYLRFGAGRLVGGTQVFPDALRSALLSLGGRVRCGAPVEEILMRDGRAAGVRLESGEELLARQGVLASCDPRTALTSLLPPGALDHESAVRAKYIPSYGSGIAILKADVALSGRLTLDRYERRRNDRLDLRLPGAFIGGFDIAREAEADSVAGGFPTTLNMYAAIPTGIDPTQAPEGQDTLWLFGAPVPLRPNETWQKIGPEAGDALIARAAEHITGIDDLELGRWVETPDQMAERTRATNGCFWHVDLSLLRLGPLRPTRTLAGYTTPIPGFYLGSAGCHPTPGMSGLPGKLAARELLRATRDA